MEITITITALRPSYLARLADAVQMADRVVVDGRTVKDHLSPKIP